MDYNVCMSQRYWEGKTSPLIIKRGVKPERHSTGKTSARVVWPVWGKTLQEWSGAAGEYEKEHQNIKSLRNITSD